jgi:GcrA cell cycle regulator
MTIQSTAESAEAIIGHPVAVPVAKPAFESVWTESRTAEMTKMWMAGMSASTISRLMDCGISRSSIISKVHRLKLERKGPAISFFKRAAVDRETRKRLRKQAAIGDHYRRLAIATNAPPSMGLDIIDLNSTACRFPYGDGPFTFCGHTTHEASSYCHAHLMLTTVPVNSGDTRKQRNSITCEPAEAA